MYREIVELDYIDIFTSSGNYELVIEILLYLVDFLESDIRFEDSYDFEIIEYGFQGLYPVIAIRHLTENASNIEALIIDEFQKILKENTLKDFVEFSIQNHSKFKHILAKFK